MKAWNEQRAWSRWCCGLIAILTFSVVTEVQSQILSGVRSGGRRAALSPSAGSGYQSIELLSNPAQYFSSAESSLIESESDFHTDDPALLDPTSFSGEMVAEHDEVWFLDGRSSHYNPYDLNLVRTSRMIGRQWQDASIHDLVDAHVSDQSKVTLLFVHGYRTDECHSVQSAFTFYNQVLRNCSQPRPGVRYVIWAWRSEKELTRFCRDYGMVARRSNSVGRALGQVLAQFPDRHLVLAGYSLGCQAFLTALEEPDLQFRCDASPDAGYQIALIAPALEGHYVSAQQWRQPLNHLVMKADIFDNSADRVLAGSRLLARAVAPRGNVSVQSLAANGNLPVQNISIFDLAASVGRNHALVVYTADPLIQTRVQQMVSQVSDFRDQVSDFRDQASEEK